MSEPDAAAAFAAFREAVFDDFHLMRRVRQPLPHDAYVDDVVAVGRERGFVFDADAVRAAMRAGQQAWLMQGADP